MRARLDFLTTAIGDCEVVVASSRDAATVLWLRDRLARWLLDRGIRQWEPAELPAEWIEDWIAAGSVYLVRHKSELVGSVTITSEDRVTWGEREDLAGYIHMLMVDPAFSGHGVGRSILNWCEARIEADSRDLARLDCVRGNERLRRYYEEAGYRPVGYKDFSAIPWARETALYEKSLGGRTESHR